MRNELTRASVVTVALGAAVLVGPLAAPAAAVVDPNDLVVVNDDDLVDVDDTLNNISTNVLGVQADDNNLALLTSLGQ
ncbi:hypothetical protein FHX37_4062 [Haloactinospora alba]|uniref:Secreted protein n=1 Tax=Haloactinospora alba TaxID=405555 RepID=A0A543NA49_9ACTN|nr:hypothetical protein [Haloactinospora alba]TQN28702.1 hypothetical protein FHX37_4062 [Haloactinospora alba]